MPRFIKLAETSPDDPAAVDALLWVTDLAAQRVVIVQELLPLYGRAVDLLLERDRIDDPRVGLACLRGLRYDCTHPNGFCGSPWTRVATARSAAVRA